MVRFDEGEIRLKMDRSRDARRASMAAVNGGGLSRRRQRTNSLRDSPEEDGGMEMQETWRSRDRGGKKDRDRDRSSRNKRRRVDRVLHESNREEGDDTSEDSVDEEDDDPVPVIRPPPPPMSPSPSPASSSLLLNHSLSNNHNHNHNHNQRKSFPPKVVRAPAVWKVADEMIGVSIPRKARTGSGHGGGGGGGGGGGSSGGTEPANRQAPTSPARPSPASTAPISPSSSNASVRKKMKQMSDKKNRIPKGSKSPSSVQDIEFEVAEVLFGMTRQISGTSKQDAQKSDSKDANLLPSNEAKSRVSSPNSISVPPAASQPSILPPPNSSSSGAPLPAVVAPKRKRPRPVKFEDESSTCPSNPAVPSGSVSSGNKIEVETTTKMEPPSPKSDKELPSGVLGNGLAPADLCLPQDNVAAKGLQQDSTKPDSSEASDLKPSVPPLDVIEKIEAKEDTTSSKVVVDANWDEASDMKADEADNSPQEKFKIDLMAPPPGKSSPEVESSADVVDHSYTRSDSRTGKDVETGEVEEERAESATKQDAEEHPRDKKVAEKCLLPDMETKEPQAKPRPLDLQLDADKPEKVEPSSNRQQAQKQQPLKLPKTESKPDKVQSGGVPLPVAIPGWPGALPPPFGYISQAPAFPIDGSTGSSKPLQPPQLPSSQPRKRCATHCYIAQNIFYHQQLARVNPFWPAAPGGVPIYGAKSYNLNAMPSSDPMLNNPLQAGFPVRNLGSLQDKGGQSVASFGGHSSKDKNSVANTLPDVPQRKQLVNQQAAQPSSTNNMLHAPALIFPLSQQQQAAAAAVMRSGPAKSGAGAGSAALAFNTSISTAMNAGTTAPASSVGFNYANLSPNEAQQYLAIFQNNGYPFPIPAHVGAPPQYRGSPAQAIPFFNGSFYATQMLHPSQVQPQPQPQQPHPTQQGHQNTSNSTGSASSQKVAQQQSQRLPVVASGSVGPSHGLPTSKPRQQLPHQTRDGDIGGEESPSTADSQLSQAQKTIYGTNFTMPFHPQDFAFMSSAAALGRTSAHGEKQNLPPSQQPQQQRALSQAFAMPFPTFNGSGTAPPAGLDIASIAQSQSFLQSLPEAARQGYQQIAAAAQAAQHKKPHQSGTEDGKATGETTNVNVSLDNERKLMSAGKSAGVFSQHSIAFSGPDSDAPIATISSNSAASSITSVAGSNSSNTQQQQQQQQNMMQQLQRQRQHQQIQMQQQLAPYPKSAASSNNAGVYSDRLPLGSVATKFPSMGSFPQPLGQGNQPSQWKNSPRMGAVAPPLSQNSAPVKSPPSQQQARSGQPTLSSSGHQTQISFGSTTSLKAQSTGTASVAMGSPQASLSKTGGSSPKASTVSKSGPQSTTLPPQQQPLQSKSSQSSSNHKSSPGNSRNMPSILGHPNVAHTAQNSSTNAQHHQQQQLPKHPIPPGQIFFSSPYIQQVQSSQASAASGMAGYYQRRSSDQQQQQGSSPQQQQPNSNSLGHLAGRNASSDPAKTAGAAAAASNMKGLLPQTNLLQPAHFAAPGAHQLISAPVGFPYVHTIPSVSVKSTANQKPTAGNDNLHACWQPEKR